MVIFTTALTDGYFVHAQVPQGFNYQAVARNATGTILANTGLGVRIGILADTNSTVYVWEEQHNITTNNLGIFNLVIGTGSKLQGSAASFSAIDWTTAPLFLRIQLYIQGTWKYMGAAKLWSVPYSMVSGKTGGVATGSKLAIVSGDDTSQDALFEVKEKTVKQFLLFIMMP